MTHKILIVEDDVDIGNLLEDTLQGEGYSTARAYSGTEAALLIGQNRYDLILLDLMLPGLSGEEIVERAGASVPIIVLSAKVGIDDKVNVLSGGAADYMTKPFNNRELLARIKVQLREKRSVNRAPAFKNLRVDTDLSAAYADGKELKLTKTEFLILKFLIETPNRVYSKAQIADALAGSDREIWESSLSVHIHNLRKKIYDACGKWFIETVWGIGYKLQDDKS